jgi:hypothetical protein
LTSAPKAIPSGNGLENIPLTPNSTAAAGISAESASSMAAATLSSQLILHVSQESCVVRLKAWSMNSAVEAKTSVVDFNAAVEVNAAVKPVFSGRHMTKACPPRHVIRARDERM